MGTKKTEYEIKETKIKEIDKTENKKKVTKKIENEIMETKRAKTKKAEHEKMEPKKIDTQKAAPKKPNIGKVEPQKSDTKKRILDVALTLFSEKGYGNVFVGQIAEGVGIKAPSLYKHYKSKQDIFEAILREMRERYDKQAADMNMTGDDFQADSSVFNSISEDELVQRGIGLFSFFLHDEYECKFRKMLTLEQFSDKELAKLFSDQYFVDPIKYQSGLLHMLSLQGCLKNEDPDVMALQFFAPIYLLMTVCDREPEREAEALQTLEKHIRQFNKMYKCVKGDE